MSFPALSDFELNALLSGEKSIVFEGKGQIGVFHFLGPGRGRGVNWRSEIGRTCRPRV